MRETLHVEIALGALTMAIERQRPASGPGADAQMKATGRVPPQASGLPFIGGAVGLQAVGLQLGLRSTPRTVPATGVKRPQSNGIVERLHRTLLGELFCVEGRRTWFERVDEMQPVLDTDLEHYNQRRPRQGRDMNGRTPAKAFIQGLPKPARRERKPAENSADQHAA